jgi:hypothetical protein
MKEVTRRPDRKDAWQGKETLELDGVCRVGHSGTKVHRARITRIVGTNKHLGIHPGYGCPTSDRQAYKAHGFQRTGLVTCEACGGPYKLVEEVN